MRSQLPPSSDELRIREDGNTGFKKVDRELKIQLKIMLTSPRLKAFFRNWALLEDMLPALCRREGTGSPVLSVGGKQVK